MEDIPNSSPIASISRDELFSPSRTNAVYSKESKKLKHLFGRFGTDTSSSESSSDDEGDDASPHLRERSVTVKSEQKKDLTSGSGTPINHSEAVLDNGPEEVESLKTKTNTRTTLAKALTPQNPFNAQTPDAKKASTKKQKSSSVVRTAKPTPIAEPMAISGVSEAALQEARMQHEKLREQNHPEFTSNVFGAHNPIASVKKKKKADAAAEFDEPSTVINNGESQKKKRKREQSEKHNQGTANGKPRKKSKKDGKKLSEEKSNKSEENVDDDPGNSNERKTGEEHSTVKKKKTKQSKPKEDVDVEELVQPDPSSSSSSSSTNNNAESDHNATKTSTGKQSKPSTTKSSSGGKATSRESAPNSKDDTKTKSQPAPAPSSSTTATATATTTTIATSTLTTQETNLLTTIKTLLPPAQLHAALSTIQQAAKKSHKAKARANTPQSTDDTAVILTATRDTLVLLAGKRLAASLSLGSSGSADEFQSSANALATVMATTSAGKCKSGLVPQVMGMGMGMGLEGELGRIVVEKQKEVEKLQAENALLRELVGMSSGKRKKKET